MIDRFTRDQFEQALPRDKRTNERLWLYQGMEDGEETYHVPVPNICSDTLYIVVRSSIGPSGVAASTGQDSIRVWLMDGSTPMGSKLGAYVTRVPGWQDRLTEKLRIYYRLGMKLHLCPKCGQLNKLFKCKQGQNKGRLFQNCGGKDCGTVGFEWLTDPIKN